MMSSTISIKHVTLLLVCAACCINSRSSDLDKTPEHSWVKPKSSTKDGNVSEKCMGVAIDFLQGFKKEEHKLPPLVQKAHNFYKMVEEKKNVFDVAFTNLQGFVRKFNEH